MASILIAPNAFKGALTAMEAATAISEGLACHHTILFPIADGGDGTLPILTRMLKADLVKRDVSGPFGNPVSATYGWIGKTKTAIIELAEASGIRLMEKHEPSPWKTTTFGTGELILEAVKKGAAEILLTLGGSATVDGGIGILAALGVRFYNGNEEIKKVNAAHLEDITRYDAGMAFSLLRNTSLTILSDVENPLLGQTGSAAVFGPQKGATPEDVVRLEKGLENLAKVIEKQEGSAIGSIRYGGAAGGVAAVVHGIFRATLVAGAPYILKLGDFESLLPQVDLVITGEGKLDEQTLHGKGPGEVARLSRKAGKRVIGVCGFSELGGSYAGYFDQVIEIADRNLSLDENIRTTREGLCMAGKGIF